MSLRSIVVPCFNEAESLPRLLSDFEALTEGQAVDWELLLVDNGSTDSTAAVLARELKMPGRAFARAVTVPAPNIGYGHGIMTLMLTEMLGMSPDEETDKKVRSMTERAIKLIIRAQQVPKSEANLGGWRYEPASSDSDISVSVWQLMSLRAAKNSGIDMTCPMPMKRSRDFNSDARISDSVAKPAAPITTATATPSSAGACQFNRTPSSSATV